MIIPYKPGDVELKSCLLYNYNKKVIDIRHLTVEFNIYHDIFDHGITCELVLADSNGIVEFMPIVGEETLVISFKTPTFDNLLTYVFRVYSITDKNKSEQRSDVFVIHGVSQEGLSNQRKGVKKSYVDLPASTIVKSIYNEFLKPTEEEYGIIKKNKVLEIEETKDNVSLVVPDKKPFDVINYLAGEAESKNDQESLASNFIFFEDADGWHFKTIDSMLTQDAVENFFLVDAQVEQDKDMGDKINPHQKISNLDFESQLDTLENLEMGLYFNTIETIDPITKRFTKDSYLYERDSSKIGHVEKSFNNRKYLTENSIFKNDAGSSKSIMIISNIGENYSKQNFLNAAVTNDPQIRNPRKIHKFLKYDIASRLQLENISFSVTVPGNSDIRIGDIVNLHIPQSTSKKDFEKKVNILYDKRFFIIALRHTYNKKDNSFFTVFECVKDSFAKELVEVE
jgi:hypothetical protein